MSQECELESNGEVHNYPQYSPTSNCVANICMQFLPSFSSQHSLPPKTPQNLRQGLGAKLFCCKQRELRMRLAQLPQRPCQARDLRAVHAVHAAEIGLALGHGRQAAIEGRPGRIRNDLGRQVGTASRKPNGGFKFLAFFGRNLQKLIEKSLGRAQIMVSMNFRTVQTQVCIYFDLAGMYKQM